MKNLNDIRDVQRAIQSAVQAKGDVSLMQNILLETPPISIQQRLEIYQEGYEARLEESLRDDFERVQQQLGSTEDFAQLMEEFILKCPSKVRNIAEYSEDFVTFIKENKIELYESALSDWYSLVAAKMPDVVPTNILSVQEIQAGVPFQVRTFFSTIPFKSEKKYFRTVRKQDEIEVKEISSADFELIQFLSKSQLVETFVEKAQDLKLTDTDIAQKINEWITQQVIYCERI